jgi:hypothetical protein
MHSSRSKIPSKKSCPYIDIHVKFLALLGAPCVYDISRLRVKDTFRLLNKYIVFGLHTVVIRKGMLLDMLISQW